MNKSQFKTRWESDEKGGNITFDEIALCAKEWGIFKNPKTQPISLVRYRVLKAADTEDAESFNTLAVKDAV